MAQEPQELVFSLNKRYQLLENDNPVTVDVIVGEKEQSPNLTVKLNSKTLLKNFTGSIKNLPVDINSALDGKVLKISGTVLDTAPDSNKIDVTLKVKGGDEELSRKFSVTLEDDGEIVDVAFVIRFKL